MGDDVSDALPPATARRAGCRRRDPRSVVLELRRRWVRHPAVRGDPTDPGPHDRAGGRRRNHSATRDRGADDAPPRTEAPATAPPRTEAPATTAAAAGTPATTTAPAGEGSGTTWWPWLLVGLAVVAIIVGIVLFLRSRRAPGWPDRCGHRPRRVRRDHHASRRARARRAGGSGQCRCREAGHAHGFGPATGGLGA